MMPVAQFLLLAMLSAGPPESGETKPSELVERVDVSLVQRTIFAFDRDGRPVTDLSKDELEVKDEGKRYEIAILDPRNAPPEEDDLPVVRVMLDAPGGPPDPVESTAREPGYYVVLLDMIHRPVSSRDEINEEVRRVVGASFRPEELVSVLSFTGDIHMELPFTNDPALLEKAIDEAYARPAAPMPDPGRRLRGLMRRLRLCRNEDREGLPACVSQLSGSYQAEVAAAARQFLRFLQGGVRYAAGLDGRKTLIVVSQGASMDSSLETRAAMAAVLGTGFTGLPGDGECYEMTRVIDEANEHDVTMHFVSVPPAGSGDFSAASGAGVVEPGVEPLAIAYRGASDGMRLIARETGGQHVSMGSIEQGLTEVIDLDRGGYHLGYYVDRRLEPGKLRRFKIRCKRPGVSIHTARAYAPERRDPGEIELNVTLTGFEKSDGGLYRVPFRLEADPR